MPVCVKDIVGAAGVGKNQLARAILNVEATLNLHIRTCEKLPQPECNAAERPSVDFVIMMVDLSNRESYFTVKRSLRAVDVGFFIGKLCFVLSEVYSGSRGSVTIETVTDLAESCGCNYICCNVQNADELREVAEQLTSQIRLCTGRTPVSFLEFDATDPTSCHYDISTLSFFCLPPSLSMTDG